MATGALCPFGTAAQLEPTPLSQFVFTGFALFWLARLLSQFFIYDRGLWRGKPFETIMHVAFSCLWLYLTVVFSYGALRGMMVWPSEKKLLRKHQDFTAFVMTLTGSISSAFVIRIKLSMVGMRSPRSTKAII